MRGGLPLAMGVALLAAGCGGGSPTHFYTLATVPPTVPLAGGSCAGPPLAVANVVLPETLDRQEIVRAAGADELKVSNADRWAAPLDGLIQRTLAQDLQHRLPAGRVLTPGDATPPGGAMTLQLNVQRFLADTSGRVSLNADWTLVGQTGKPVIKRSDGVSATTDGANAETAAGMSTALGVLADHIARALASCPT